MNKLLILITVLISSLQSFAMTGTQEVTAEIVDDRIVVNYMIPEDRHQVIQKDFFKIEAAAVEGLNVEPTVYPAGAIKGKAGDEYHGLTTLSRKLVRTGEVSARKIKITALYQLCDEAGTCFMPQRVEFELELPEAILSAAIAGSQPSPEKSTLPSAGSQQTTGLAFMMLLAFLGGLILNLMPCVLPVLSIKMMSIVNSAHKGKSDIIKGSLIYTGGVLASFAVLAIVIIAIKSSGEAVGWGFQFQNPIFVFSLLLLIWAFALSLFDVFMIQAPGIQTATKASSGHGPMGTFMSGVFAVLLATPCTAPLLGSAIGFAFQQSSPVIFVMLMLVGLGLAFPFILLGFLPVMKIIPKPGNWMNTFREVMAFLLIATAVFLARSLSFIIAPNQFINVLWFILVFSLSLWLYGKYNLPQFSKKKQWFATLIALTIAIGGGYGLVDFSEDEMAIANEQTSSDVWQKFSPELLEKYRSEKKAVFVDFSAEWCMTCKTNEAMVLNTAAIQEAFRSKKVELLHGDFTRKNPLVLEWLQKYERGGVPLYLLFRPGEQKAVVFPEVLTPSQIRDALDKL